MASLAQINVLFRADLDQFSSEMQNAQRELQKTGKKMQEIGAQMSTYLTAPLVAIGAFSSKISMDFDDSMRKVMATTNATEAEFKSLTATAEEMGAKTRYTASQSAEAMNYMALAGWKSQQIIEGIPGVLALAAASGEDLGMVADILTDGLTAMGKGAEQASQFVDVLAASASNSNTTVGMMGQAFQYAAPLAGAFGYEVEDLAKAIGLMANAGIKGEKAGTALRALMTRMVKPTREAQKAMTDLGLEVKNTDGSMKPLGDVIDQLRTKFSGLTDAQKGQYAGMLAGQEAISGLLAIVNAAPADFDKLSKAVENSAGTAKRMQDQMEGGIGGAWREMSSAIEGVAIQIGQVLEPAFRGIVTVIKDLSNWFMGLSDTTKQVIVVVGGFAAAIGPVLLALGAILKILPLVAAGYAAITLAVNTCSAAMLANPITAVVLALTTLTASLMLAKDGYTDLTNSQSNLNDINNQVIRTTGKQIVELERLIKIAKDVKETDDNRLEAIKKINAIAPEYLGNITKESINTNTATRAINKYVEALKNKARQQAITDKQGVLYAKLLEKESESVLSLGGSFGQEEVIIRNREEFDKYVKSIGASGAKLTMLESKFKVVNEQRQKDISAIKEQITYMDKLSDVAKQEAVNIEVGVQSDYAKKSFLNIYEDFKNTDVPPVEVPVDFTLGSGSGDKGDKFLKGSVAFYEAQIKGLEEMRANTALSIDEYTKYADAIDAVQKKIDSLSGKREKATAITKGDYSPAIEGSTVAMERQIDILKNQQAEIKKTYGEASVGYQALENQIKDIEFKIKADVDDAKLSVDGFNKSLSNTIEAIDGQEKGAKDIMTQKAEEAAMWGQIMGNTFQQLGEGIVGSMGEAGSALGRFGQEMMAVVIKVIAMGLAQSMSNAVVIGTEGSKGMGPIGPFVLPALIAGAMGAVMASFAKVPKFADGGIVSGPTFGLMGEYAGAANNPEVIAPLNKLKDLIEPANSGPIVIQNTLGGGFEIDGTKLRLVLDRTSTRSKRIG
ncbi:phage tail tape measure protein [Myroides marinus]|uniref:phage tail tape measure protein n=1 Tax=Myroides marinus TaxID=703342 RepID=UPI002578A47F|nr:phage tail tape measure protein [Myroides marinus]MDM1378822.1 phage tail tape measure protein [Myroides marinus]MDM1386093.1 phage tail tape measure protein [Myroides marinus]MDM1393306.1 phage tail tape measure protein [Myroides marinus]